MKFKQNITVKHMPGNSTAVSSMVDFLQAMGHSRSSAWQRRQIRHGGAHHPGAFLGWKYDLYRAPDL